MLRIASTLLNHRLITCQHFYVSNNISKGKRKRDEAFALNIRTLKILRTYHKLESFFLDAFSTLLQHMSNHLGCISEREWLLEPLTNRSLIFQGATKNKTTDRRRFRKNNGNRRLEMFKIQAETTIVFLYFPSVDNSFFLCLIRGYTTLRISFPENIPSQDAMNKDKEMIRFLLSIHNASGWCSISLSGIHSLSSEAFVPPSTV